MGRHPMTVLGQVHEIVLGAVRNVPVISFPLVSNQTASNLHEVVMFFIKNHNYL